LSVDQILNYEGELPKEVTVKDKKGFEQLNMINQLDEEDKSTVFKSLIPCLPKRSSKTSSIKTLLLFRA